MPRFARILPVLLLVLTLAACKGPKVTPKNEPDLAARDTAGNGETLFVEDFEDLVVKSEDIRHEWSHSVPQYVQWEVPAYSYAKLYVYNLSHKESTIIFQGKLNHTVVPGTERDLNEAECRQVIEAISHPPEEKYSRACFLPHYGVVFYDETNAPVAWASIGLMCRLLGTEPASNTVGDFHTLRALFEKKGLPVYTQLDDWNRYRDDSLWVPKPHEEK